MSVDVDGCGVRHVLSFARGGNGSVGAVALFIEAIWMLPGCCLGLAIREAAK